METFVITAAVGVVVGILSGLLGIGGGTLTGSPVPLGFRAFGSRLYGNFAVHHHSHLAGGFYHPYQEQDVHSPAGHCVRLGWRMYQPFGRARMANMSPAWMVMLAAAIIIGFSSFKMFRKAARMPKNPASGKAMGVDAGKSGR